MQHAAGNSSNNRVLRIDAYLKNDSAIPDCPVSSTAYDQITASGSVTPVTVLSSIFVHNTTKRNNAKGLDFNKLLTFLMPAISIVINVVRN